MKMKKRIRKLEARVAWLEGEMNKRPQFSYTGGVVKSGARFLVGENGPETFTTTANATVFDGRRIVEALREYERRSGTRWREDPPPQRSGVVA